MRPTASSACAAVLVAGTGLAACLVAQEPHAGAVAIAMEDAPQRREALAGRIAAAPAIGFPQGGLCGVLGGARVRLLGGKPATVQLPLPQRMPGQQPVGYAITAEPAAAVEAFWLRPAGGGSDCVQVALRGRPGQEVRLDWAAVVLLADRPQPGEADAAAAFARASPCAQADHDEIRQLAARLWPAAEPVAAAARALQQFVREQQQARPPRSLDALGILASGANGICTGNANLALAVLRQRGVPARSLAVVPPIGQRLEMHRIVEWFAEGHWHRFDPSAVTADVPMRTSQSVVMALTGFADEERSMRPRMGAMPGCPWGQEIEVIDGPVSPWGQDFFWTEAKPLAAFAGDDAAFAAAASAWAHFLATGRIQPAAERAAEAGTAAAFAAAWQER